MLLSLFVYTYLVKPRWMNYPHHLHLNAFGQDIGTQGIYDE